jgi:hypothetical protein
MDERRSTVLQIIEARFGPTPPDLESAVADLTNHPDMGRVLVRVATANSLAELLASVTSTWGGFS